MKPLTNRNRNLTEPPNHGTRIPNTRPSGVQLPGPPGLLATLTTAFTHSGGWVLERKTVSATTVEFRIEIQLKGIVELYAGLVESGLELTRGAHDTLTALCTSRKHIAASPRPGQLLSIRLELNFLDDVTLHSLLMTGSGLA